MVLGGAAMLSKVAPGISGALLTTVAGLLVAIPSSVGYNLLMSNIRQLVVSMENFSEEFLADLDRHYTA
jgi:biopolymer transport protein TolQ